MKGPHGPALRSTINITLTLTIHTALLPSQEDAENSEHWVMPNGLNGGGGCVVVIEGDPPPASPLGRLSFKGFNPATDKLRVRCTFATLPAFP